MTRAAVLDALARVRDPELDEPITDLGFVAAVEVEGDSVDVALRLPPHFCAPTFAYLMAADAKAAILSVAGVREARVTLADHFAGEEITAGVAGGRGFQATFPGDADAELDELRRLFQAKAFVARQQRLCRALLARGLTPEELARMRLQDLPPGEEMDTYLERRADLGLEVGRAAPFLVNPRGEPIPPAVAAAHLRRARAVRVSIEGNAAFCRDLLSTRYGVPVGEEAER